MDLRPNINKIYFFRFFKDFWLIMPILIPFYKSHSLNDTQILLTQAVFSASLLLFEIPSGYFSDTIGRRLTPHNRCCCPALRLLVYLTGETFLQFALAEAVLGFGFAMCSGTESALLYDSLASGGMEGDYYKCEGKAESASRIGCAAASVAGGFLALINLNAPFIANAATGLLMFLTALTLAEPERIKRKAPDPLADVIRIVKYSLSHREILPIMIKSSAVIITGITAIWGYLLLSQKYGLSTSFNGIGFACFQLSSAAGAAFSSGLSRRIGRRMSQSLLFVIPVIFLLTAVVESPLVLIISVFHAFIWGFSFPFFMNELNTLIESDMRATVLSTGGMTGRTIFVIISPLFGAVSDKYSPGASFVFLAVIFLALFSAGRITGAPEYEIIFLPPGPV